MSSKGQIFEKLFFEVEKILSLKVPKEEKLKKICKLLQNNVPYYNWVGFYFVDKEKGNELVLGPFVGEPTEHVRIPFGRGVCGRAAVDRRTVIIQDVSRETNYLSCSPKVRSEIVIPIFKDGNFIGELDIDSHFLSPFTDEDRNFLEKVSEAISKVL